MHNEQIVACAALLALVIFLVVYIQRGRGSCACAATAIVTKQDDPLRAMRITFPTPEELDSIEGGSSCQTSDWVDSRACNNACSNANKVQQRRQLSPPGTCEGVAMVQTISCPDGPCTCYKQNLLELIGPNGGSSNVTFCGGVCENAQQGQECRVGCQATNSQGGSLTVVGTPRFTCLKTTEGRAAWVGDPAGPSAGPFACAIAPPKCDTPAFLNASSVVLPGSKCTDAGVGDVCAIACHVGTTPSGGMNRAMCQVDGSWSYERLGCVPQICNGGGGIDCTFE